VNGLVANVVVYCAADGKEKMPGSDIFLIPYKISKPTNTTVPTVNTQNVTEEVSEVDLLNKIEYFCNKNFLNS
jgi:hypothetical protein